MAAWKCDSQVNKIVRIMMMTMMRMCVSSLCFGSIKKENKIFVCFVSSVYVRVVEWNGNCNISAVFLELEVNSSSGKSERKKMWSAGSSSRFLMGFVHCSSRIGK